VKRGVERRRSLQVRAVLLVGLAVLLGLPAGAAAQPPGDWTAIGPLGGELTSISSPGSGTRPNILFVVTDDQRLDGTVISAVMPKTVAWFKNAGEDFTNAMPTTPLCCPSRSSIMSGRFAHNHNVLSNSEEANFDQNLSIQRYLHNAGYKTGLVGELLNNWPLGNPPQNPLYFDRWWLLGSGYCPFVVNEQGVRVRYPVRQEPFDPANECFPGQLGQRADSPYSTSYLTGKAIDFLRETESADTQPWYLYVAPYAPHAPYEVEARFKDAPLPPVQRNAATFEPNLSDKPSWVRSVQLDAQSIFGDPGSTPPFSGLADDQRRTLMSVDDLVDQVFTELQNDQELSNTLAIFVSDNGYYWGEHGMIGKGHPYMQGLKVPMTMRFPQYIAANSVDSRYIANIDMAPTALDAAGVSPSTPMDGRSLLDPTWTRDRMLTEWWRGDDVTPPNHPPWASLVTPGYQYIEHYTDDASTIQFREYYDLSSDPQELTNLYGGDGVPTPDDPPSSPSPATLSSRLATDRICSGASCP
jgi:arylsulfatase A-like enzyme